MCNIQYRQRVPGIKRILVVRAGERSQRKTIQADDHIARRLGTSHAGTGHQGPARKPLRPPAIGPAPSSLVLGPVFFFALKFTAKTVILSGLSY